MSDTLSPISDLPLRHQRFIVEYLQDGNATQAAIRAGFKADNADVQGSQLLGKLKRYVEPMGRGVLQRRLIKAEEIVEGLGRIAQANFGDFATWEGNTLKIKSSAELTPEQKFCIESIEQRETQHTKYLRIKLYNKQKAYDLLTTISGMKKPKKATDKGLMVVYQRPKAEAIPDNAKIVEGEVVEGKWKPNATRIAFKRPTPKANGHTNGNGHSGNGSAKNGLHIGPETHDQGTA